MRDRSLVVGNGLHRGVEAGRRRQGHDGEPASFKTWRLRRAVVARCSGSAAVAVSRAVIIVPRASAWPSPRLKCRVPAEG